MPAAVSLAQRPAPEVLRAECTPPAHTCHTEQKRSVRHGMPLVVLHHGQEHTTLRLFVPRPLELTRAGRSHLLRCFETAGITGLLSPGCRASVHPTLAEFVLPPDLAGPFATAMLEGVSFAKVPV